jgi:hypothetical protein
MHGQGVVSSPDGQRYGPGLRNWSLGYGMDVGWNRNAAGVGRERSGDGRRSSSLRTPGSPAFLGAAEPRKLRVQHRDGLGRGLGQGREDRSGVWLRLGLSLQARTPVAGLSFAAACANAPQLLAGLIK